MMWRDVIHLVTLTSTSSQDEYGGVVEKEHPRTIFANKKSARQSEFYQAMAVGLKPDIVFEIRNIDYEDEPRIQYEGITFYIIRTFSKNDEILELICSRSPLKGG